MTKQTKMLLGLGALAVVGYIVWTKMSGTKANASGKKKSSTARPIFSQPPCPKGKTLVNTPRGGLHCMDNKELERQASEEDANF